MAKIRLQVITRRAADLAIDHVVNTVYVDDFNLQSGSTDYQRLADDARDVFKARSGLPYAYGCEAKAYDMADAEPRPVKATAVWQQGAADFNGSSGPREVALCLSFYAARNLPRYRGRLYLGPWISGVCLERPNSAVISSARAVGTGIAALGGVSVDWQLYSPTRLAFSKVTNVWVDDEWDTVRSRGLKATSRSTGATGE